MKKILVKPIRNILIIVVMIISYQGFTQPPPPPGGSSGGGNTHDNRNGGGAPVGSGLLILLGLGGIYGGYKINKASQKQSTKHCEEGK